MKKLQEGPPKCSTASRSKRNAKRTFHQSQRVLNRPKLRANNTIQCALPVTARIRTWDLRVMSPARNQLRHNAILKVLHTSLLFKLLQRQTTPIEPDVSSASGIRHFGTIRNLTEVQVRLTARELGHTKYGYTSKEIEVRSTRELKPK